METSDRQNKKLLSEIKIIGFDLDGTLYESTEEIQSRIRDKIYEKISLGFVVPFGQAKNLFEENYAITSSGSRTIKKLEEQFKIKLEKDLIQNAIQEADVLDLIYENLALVNLLERLNKKYSLDLLTSGERNQAIRKLEKIGINQNIFGYFLSAENGSKTYGTKFVGWVEKRGNRDPRTFLYIGDNKRQDVDSPRELGIVTCFIGKYNQADFEIKNIMGLERLLL